MERNRQNDTLEVSKLWNINYIILLGINILSHVAFNLVTPLLSEHVIGLGASLKMAGVIAGVFAITALFIGPFGGILTDRFKKKYVLIIATIINGIATLGYSLAPNIELLMFFRMLHGAGFSITIAANLAWIADYIPKNRMGEGVGYFGIAQIIGIAVGPAVGIEAAGHFGISRVFMAAATLLFIASLCMIFVSNISQNVAGNKEVKKRKIGLKDIVAFEILPLSLIGGLFSLGNGLVISFLVLLGDERNISGVGLYFTVNALFLFFIRPIAGKLYDRKGLSFILYPALLFSFIEALLLGFAHSLWMIVLAAIFKAFGQGIGQPAIQAESLRKLGSERRGLASSTVYIGANIGQGFGPLLGGSVATLFGYQGMFSFSAILLIGGILGYALYTRKSMREQSSDSCAS